MPSKFIDNPELNRLYLIKRNKSGDPLKRFQPGTIIEIKKAEGCMLTWVCTVHWLFDGEITQDVMMFYGLVKELTRKWLDDEDSRKNRELKALKIALHHIDQLRFNPSHMSKITS